MKRVATAELLDTDSGTSAEVAASLGDLRRINRWFGGVATTEDMIWRVAREISASSLSLLEVAAGSGYVPETAGAATVAAAWIGACRSRCSIAPRHI